MSHKGLNRPKIFINCCDHFREKRRRYCFTTTYAVPGSIKRQYFITLVDQGLDIMTKIYNRRFKAVYNKDFSTSITVPSESMNRYTFQFEVQFFSFAKDLSQSPWVPALWCTKEIERFLC